MRRGQWDCYVRLGRRAWRGMILNRNAGKRADQSRRAEQPTRNQRRALPDERRFVGGLRIDKRTWHDRRRLLSRHFAFELWLNRRGVSDECRPGLARAAHGRGDEGRDPFFSWRL